MSLKSIFFSKDPKQAEAQIGQLKTTDSNLHQSLIFDANFNTYPLSQIRNASEEEIQALKFFVKSQNGEDYQEWSGLSKDEVIQWTNAKRIPFNLMLANQLAGEAP